MNFRLMKRTPMYQVTRGIVLRRQCGQPSQAKFENLSYWCIDWFKKSDSVFSHQGVQDLMQETSFTIEEIELFIPDPIK